MEASRQLKCAWVQLYTRVVSQKTREDIKRVRSELRALYRDAYQRLEALLFEEDPIGLNFGHNTDEYDPEVQAILPRLRSCATVDDVQAVVHDEFMRLFAPESAGMLSKYRRIAERIVEELPELLPR